jgi:hypothetical protein
MKRFLLLPFLLLAMMANARNYYVSAAGNDANAGTSSTAAWKTLAKVNSFVFAANDSILFNRGDVFYGSIIVNRSNLFFSAYGTGAKPLITGFTTLTSWKLIGGGVYEAVVNAPKDLNMVSINGRPQQMGRYPNASDANGGYLTYETFGSSSITDNQLSSTVNWTGADVAVRKNQWILDRNTVTAQSGGTISYKMRDVNANPGLYSCLPNYGYFFMNDVRTLDQFGEWYFDVAAKKVKVYFGSNVPSNYTVQVSTVDTLFDINLRTNVTVSNINFEGANSAAVFALNAGYINVLNCDITNIGIKAIEMSNTPNILIENVNTTNILSNAMQIINRRAANVTVRNCVVKNTAPFAGMGSYYEDNDNKGIYIVVSNNLLIEYNIVDTVGLSGIQYQGNDVMVKNNVVNYYCYRLHDGGGIYTWSNGTNANPGSYYTNRTVKSNIVMNGIGAPLGTTSSNPLLAGIFLDGRSMNVNVLDNTVFNAEKGVHSNNGVNLNIRGNVFYNNDKDISIARWAWGSISNITIKKNTSFSTRASQLNFAYMEGAMNSPVVTTLQNCLKAIGNIDSNYYHSVSGTGIETDIHEYETSPLIAMAPYSLDAWKAFTGHDVVTKKPAPKVMEYTVTKTLSSNLITNGQFTSNINGVTVWGDGTTGGWDNTSKISGGALRMDFSAPTANRYGLFYGSIGGVSSSKKYLLRFTTLGTKLNGIVTAYLRKSASPYSSLVPTQMKPFGPTKTVHEFLFSSPVTEANASFIISVEQTSGTTYIDNIELVEVEASVNTFDSQVKLLYNDTKLSKTLPLDAKYVGVDSTVYNGSITLAPYSSKVIIKAGNLSSVLPVKLIEFSAKNNAEKVNVKWVTTGEINSSHYLVEKSSDGREFSTVGRINSNNRADIQSTYGFTDMVPFNGVQYYRLAMVDVDGSVAYSKVVTVNIKNARAFAIGNVKLSASASNIKINVSTSTAQLFSFAVTDVSGRIIINRNVQLEAGNNNVVTNIPAINKGVYYVRMQTPGSIITKPVLSE